MAVKGNRPEADELLTIDEVASIFKVPLKTVRAWRSNREGPRGFRVGKYVRFRRSAVDAFIAEQEEKEDML
jgi:excisionase family DNA binding protein